MTKQPILGIITEYNPFHLGHAYQLATAKHLLPEATVVVLMSGNAVQRGEFAVLDKWTRAQLAINHGADVVIEMPTLATLQSADYFAGHGVRYLSQLGCTHFLFGTEQADLAAIEAYIAWEIAQQAVIDTAVKTALAQGLAYPAAYAQAVDQVLQSTQTALAFDPSLPNHQLGIQYLKANQQLARPMQPMVVPRARQWQKTALRSGSQIRQQCQEQAVTSAGVRNANRLTLDKAQRSSATVQTRRIEGVPAATQAALATAPHVCWPDYWPLVRYQLLVQPLEQLDQIAGAKEGIMRHLQKQAQVPAHVEFESFMLAVTSKRWTRSAIQRLLLATYLQLPQQAVTQFNQEAVQALRVLAHNALGQAYLRSRRHEGLRLFPNVKASYADAYAWNLTLDQLYLLNLSHLLPSQMHP